MWWLDVGELTVERKMLGVGWGVWHDNAERELCFTEGGIVMLVLNCL